MNMLLTESSYDHLLRDLCAREETLTQELEDVRGRIETTKKFRDVFDTWKAETPLEHTGKAGRRRWHSHLGPQDIAHCTTQHEALKCIARLSGGLVNPTEAAQIVRDVGLSQGKRSSTISTLSGYLKRGTSGTG